MSDAFDLMEDYIPLALLIVLWIAVLPPRLLVLLLLPCGATSIWHPLNKLHKFFRFCR